MANFNSWKIKTAKLRRKLARHGWRVLRWNANPEEKKEHLRFDESVDRPLLTNDPKKRHKKAWDSQDEFKDMSDYAAASAMIVATFSNDTKTSASSGGLYQSESFQVERCEFPIIHKRDIFMTDGSDHGCIKSGASRPNEVSTQNRSLASYSVSGSMLCNNIEKGYIPNNSTSAARKLECPQKPHGLPPNAVMASNLFRTMKLDKPTQNAYTEKKIRPVKALAQRGIYASDSSDSRDEEGPCLTIKRTQSKDGAHSSVSSVTMYSCYHNDPLVRASNSLLDILRANKFQTFDNCEEETSVALYEA